MGDRAPSPTTPSLTTWTLATFDTSLFVLSGVLAAHLYGRLGSLLAGLNTAVGAVVFCYLWALFVGAVWWVLSDASLEESPVGSLALRGVAAGSAVGVVFLSSVVLVAAVRSLGEPSLQVGSVALIALLGAAVAAVVGGVVGLVAGLVDVLAFRLAGGVLPATGGGESGTARGDGDADRAS